MAEELFTTKHNKTKQKGNRRYRFNYSSKALQHQVDSPLDRKIWEAAMTGFTNLFKRILRSVSAIIMTGQCIFI